MYGCSSKYIQLNNNKANDIRQKIFKSKHWKISGKISCRHINQQWSSSFIWRENADDSEIRLIPIIASQQILITQSPHSAEIITKNKKIKATNIDSLVLSEINWNIPFSKLKYWVVGLPAPKQYKTIINIKENIQTIKQDGWEVIYKEFYNENHDYLPKKIFLKKEPLEIRIIINKWEKL
jgi:outer membrane lipoprotein LolB